jgi:hypothetical protein
MKKNLENWSLRSIRIKYFRQVNFLVVWILVVITKTWMDDLNRFYLFTADLRQFSIEWVSK